MRLTEAPGIPCTMHVDPYDPHDLREIAAALDAIYRSTSDSDDRPKFLMRAKLELQSLADALEGK